MLIMGQAVSVASGEAMAHVPVKIGLSVKGFDRFFTVDTDSNGNFSTTFTPAASEAGTYSLWAVHPDLSDRSVQASFDIVGLAVTPDIYNLSLARGQSFDIPVSLKNLGNAEIAGLTFATAAAEGITAVVINGGDDTLSAGENQTVTLRVSAAADAPQSGYATLTIGTAAGLSDRVEVNINMVMLIPLISTSPSLIDTGMMRGSQKIESFTLTNSGRATLRNARIEGPSLSWLSLTVNQQLGDLNVGQSLPIGLMIRPDAALPSGIYDDRLVITSDNHIPYTFNIQVTVTSDAVGSVYFDVQNELLEKVSGASILLQHEQLLELRYNLRTAADGTILLNDIPEGRYRFNISATGCQPYSGTFTIEPGLTAQKFVALEMDLIDIEWSVTETAIEDKYEIVVSQTFATNVPTPVLIADPPNITLPEMQPGEVFNGEFTITNHGLIAVQDVEIDFSATVDDFDIEVMAFAVPDRIEAMQTIRVPFRVTRRQQTVASNNRLVDEVRGFGGDAQCYKAITITVKGNCEICPGSEFSRWVEKNVQCQILAPIPCPGQTTTSFMSTQGVGIFGTPVGSGQSDGGSYPVTSSEIKTGDFCPCKKEKEVTLSNAWGFGALDRVGKLLNISVPTLSIGLDIQIKKLCCEAYDVWNNTGLIKLKSEFTFKEFSTDKIPLFMGLIGLEVKGGTGADFSGSLTKEPEDGYCPPNSLKGSGSGSIFLSGEVKAGNWPAHEIVYANLSGSTTVSGILTVEGTEIKLNGIWDGINVGGSIIFVEGYPMSITKGVSGKLVAEQPITGTWSLPYNYFN